MGAEACSQSESNTCAAKSRGRAWPHRFRTAQLYVQLSLLIKLQQLLLMRGWTQYQINQIVGGYTQLHAEELPTITPMMFNTHCSTR